MGSPKRADEKTELIKGEKVSFRIPYYAAKLGQTLTIQSVTAALFVTETKNPAQASITVGNEAPGSSTEVWAVIDTSTLTQGLEYDLMITVTLTGSGVGTSEVDKTNIRFLLS